MSDNPVDRPIFIIGVGRSGTTLMQSMLHAHRDIAFTPETHFVRRYLARPAMHRLIRTGHSETFLKIIREDSDLNRLGFDFAEIVSALKKENALSLPAFYRYLLDKWRQTKQCPYIGDKDPKNIEYLNTIYDFFPGAFIIHVIRDPRAVVLSRMNAEWSKRRSFLSHVVVYNLQLQKGRREGRRLFGNRYMEVVYEDLVTKPEEECRRLCRWLSIQYDPEMLNFHKTSHQIIKGRETLWKSECFKPVQPENKDKWSGALSRKQICLIETLTYDHMLHFGYRQSGYLKDRRPFAAIIHLLARFGMWKLEIAYRLLHRLKYKAVQMQLQRHES